MDKQVKRIVSPTDDFQVLIGHIMARIRNLVPNGRRTAFYLSTCFINSQMLSAVNNKITKSNFLADFCLWPIAGNEAGNLHSHIFTDQSDGE